MTFIRYEVKYRAKVFRMQRLNQRALPSLVGLSRRRKTFSFFVLVNSRSTGRKEDEKEAESSFLLNEFGLMASFLLSRSSNLSLYSAISQLLLYFYSFLAVTTSDIIFSLPRSNFVFLDSVQLFLIRFTSSLCSRIDSCSNWYTPGIRKPSLYPPRREKKSQLISTVHRISKLMLIG